MTTSSTNLIKKYFFVLLLAFFLSCLMGGYVTSRYNLTKYDLLHSSGIIPQAAGNHTTKSQFSKDATGFLLRCNISDNSTVSLCGIQFKLPFNEKTQLFSSIDKYQKIYFDAFANSTNSQYDGRVRITIKSIIDPNASINDLSNTKFQTIQFNENDSQEATLTDFKVATWWINMFHIPFKSSQLDFSKVISIDVYINDIPIKYSGIYQLKVNKLTLLGKHITINEFQQWMFIIWPVLIFIYLIHYALHMRKSYIIAKELIYVDKDTGFRSLEGFIRDYPSLETISVHFYLVEIKNFSHLVEHIGEKRTYQVILNQWEYCQSELGMNAFAVYRVSDSEYLIARNGKQLGQSQRDLVFKMVESGNNIEGIGQFSLDMNIALVSRESIPSLPSELLECARMTSKYAIEHNQKYAEFNLDLLRHQEEDTFIAQSIEQALRQNEFYLNFMPYYNATKKRITGAEALLRCHSANLSNMSPEVYIRVAEKKGLIKEIDLWVIENALQTIQDNKQYLNDFRLSINISSREMLDNAFVDEFKELIKKYDANPAELCLELTETFFVNIDDYQIKNIEEIRALGCTVSLDDFGTGYTSFSYLMNIPADEIKIDRSFVNNLGVPTTDVVVNSIIDISKVFQYELVAEGVETLGQLVTLWDMGCECFQGYLISKPTNFDNILWLLDNTNESIIQRINVCPISSNKPDFIT